MALRDRAGCVRCGGVLYHMEACELPAEEVVVQAIEALRYAYMGVPLQRICPCELGFPGVLGCPHVPGAPRMARTAGQPPG